MNTEAVRLSSVEIAAETHLFSSVGMIKEALVLADSDSVAVLGCGRCTEIPIRLLNEKFDRVDLIDIDGEALNFVRAEYKQWNDQKNAFQFHCADLTGMIARIEHRASELVEKAVDPVACLEQLGVLFESTAPEFWAPPRGERYDLLVCSMVLTQLQALVREIVERFSLGSSPNTHQQC